MPMDDFKTIQELKEHHIKTLIPCLIDLEMGKELEAEVFINTLVKAVQRMTFKEIERQALLIANSEDINIGPLKALDVIQSIIEEVKKRNI